MAIADCNAEEPGGLLTKPDDEINESIRFAPAKLRRQLRGMERSGRERSSGTLNACKFNWKNRKSAWTTCRSPRAKQGYGSAVYDP